MKYYLDCEFLEGTQTKRFLGLPIGQTKPTIDLISIGIVGGDGREYYTISKDFNLREAWDRFDIVTPNDGRPLKPHKKVYWVRENVLRPIFDEWQQETNGKIVRLGLPIPLSQLEFNYKNFKYCIQCIGKTNKQIAEEIKEFVYKGSECSTNISNWGKETKPQFYAYYADYDWVAFCWLFGKMMDLPKGFPMYCIDLKQEVDNKVDRIAKLHGINYSLEELKSLPNYPKQTNEHNALSDARWNKKLHEFLQTI